jgi:hypothetical protein
VEESPLSGKELDDLYQELVNGWSIVDEHHLENSTNFQTLWKL